MAIDLFIQGMRRSSTTFLFDVLLADPRCAGWYEPFAEAQKPAVGGGSRVSDVDFFAELRAARARFAAACGLSDLTLLNHGAPRDALLELRRDLPAVVTDYVRSLCGGAEITVLKFVRAWRKLPALLAARPEARVVHIVRDPRAVATSFLFGKRQRHAHLYPDADSFFRQQGPAKGNQALAIADALIEHGELDLAPDDPHVLKLLGVWQHHVRSTHGDGLALREDRYLLVRHEDMLRSPMETIDRVYRLIGKDVPQPVRRFLSEKLDPVPRIFAPADRRWRELLDRADLAAECVAAGYGDLVDG